MDIKILNWNIGGAKFLEEKNRENRAKVRSELNSALKMLINNYHPDVVTLQEIVQYREPGDSDVQDLLDPIEGYNYYPFHLIDSFLFSSRAKWNKVLNKSDWKEDTYFAQGNAMLFKKNAPLFPVWDLSDLNEKSPGRQRSNFMKKFKNKSGNITKFDLFTAEQSEIQDPKYLIEHVHLDSGLYFGDRDTEPRAALVAHLIVDPLAHNGCPLNQREPVDKRPLDIFIVNLHLVTITKERVGIPNIDEKASQLRKAQLEIVFDGIVSRYNSWADDGYPQRGEKKEAGEGENLERCKPIWILCGDFNFTEDSNEYSYIQKRNFIDTTPADGRISEYGEGTKTSGAGNPPTLTLDYIFAGPKFIAFDPVFQKAGILGNRVNHDVKVSDHYPVFSRLPLLLPRGK